MNSTLVGRRIAGRGPRTSALPRRIRIARRRPTQPAATPAETVVATATRWRDLNYSEAAAELGIPEGTLKEKVQKQEYPCTRHGKRVTFTEENLAEIRRRSYRPARDGSIPPDPDEEAQRAAIRQALIKQRKHP